MTKAIAKISQEQNLLQTGEPANCTTLTVTLSMAVCILTECLFSALGPSILRTCVLILSMMMNEELTPFRCSFICTAAQAACAERLAVSNSIHRSGARNQRQAMGAAQMTSSLTICLTWLWWSLVLFCRWAWPARRPLSSVC